MSTFVEYERHVVRALLRPHLPTERIEEVVASAGYVSYENTGAGYFLTVAHPALPQSRVFCSEPSVIRQAPGVECGFVVFLEHGQLTLECHSWGEPQLPADLRDRQIEILAAA